MTSLGLIRSCCAAKTLLMAIFTFSHSIQACQKEGWNDPITDWSLVDNIELEIGDWGLNRPGYAKGLYIHGVTMPEGKPVSNPIIYDNDEFNDVLCDDYLICKAVLNEAHLTGIIVTPVSAPSNKAFGDENGYVEWWKETAFKVYNRAANSGMCMKRIPKPVVGSTRNKEPQTDTEGARLIVWAANKQFINNPDKPLLISIGGQFNTLASAYILDTSICKKIIVYSTAIDGYNGSDTWSSRMVAENFRVINWGTKISWWKDRNCQNLWEVLPRPENCGRPKPNLPNSGEWKYWYRHDVPFIRANNENIGPGIIWLLQNHHYYDGRNKIAADHYGDAAFMSFFLPAAFTLAKFGKWGNGTIIQIHSWNSKPIHDDGLQTIGNPKVYNGKCD